VCIVADCLGSLGRGLLCSLVLAGAFVIFVRIGDEYEIRDSIVPEVPPDVSFCISLGVSVIPLESALYMENQLSGFRVIVFRASPTAILDGSDTLTNFLEKMNFTIVFFVVSLYLEGWDTPLIADSKLGTLFSSLASQIIHRQSVPHAIISVPLTFQQTLSLSVIHRSTLVAPLRRAQIPWVDMHDVVDGIVRLALDPKPRAYASRHLLFTGTTSYSVPEVAEFLGKYRSRPMKFENLTRADFYSSLSDRLDRFSAECCVDYFEFLENRLTNAPAFADVSHLPGILNRPLLPLEKYLVHSAVAYSSQFPNYFAVSDLGNLVKWMSLFNVNSDLSLSLYEVSLGVGVLLGAMGIGRYLFSALNISRKDRLPFLEYLSAVSVMSRGSPLEKIAFGRLSLVR
jgi:hypothetical protein